MTTALIRPNAKKLQYGNTINLSAIEMPIWLLLMANCFKDSVIIDAEAENLSRTDIKERVEKLNPDEIIILATGSHPSAHIQQRSEANRLALDLLPRETKVYDRLIFDPTEAGRPRWDLLPIKNYRAHNWHCWGGQDRQPYGSIFTSVSCPYNCEFCCVKSFYHTKYKVRDMKDVIQDVAELYHQYGVRNFKMMDELFVTKSPRVRLLCNELSQFKGLNIWAYARIDTITEEIVKDLKKGGVNWLAFGIESGNDDIRKSVMKGNFDKNEIRDIIGMTRDNGINVVGNYMFGFWEDTIETMEETLEFAQSLNTEYANFYCTVAYPGSPLFEDMKAKGIKPPENSEEYAQLSPIFKPCPTKTLSSEKVLQFRDKAFMEYYKSLKYLFMAMERFGTDCVKEIVEMISVPIERKYLLDKKRTNIL